MKFSKRGMGFLSIIIIFIIISSFGENLIKYESIDNQSVDNQNTKDLKKEIDIHTFNEKENLSSQEFVDNIISIDKSKENKISDEFKPEKIEDYLLDKYSDRSYIYQWFMKLKGEAKLEFAKNVILYEIENEKKRQFSIQREKNIQASYTNDEPDFDQKICPELLPITHDSKWNFCSCGDGYCASYEYKGECVLDCGPCPNGTFFRAGECIEFVPNICLNKICEENEKETCIWDCISLIYEEGKEEILIKEEEEEEYPNIPKEEYKSTTPELPDE